MKIENPDKADHVAITDALPATLEFIDPPSSASNFEHLDFRDERLDAFLNNGVQNATVSYTVRVIADGDFHWPPAEAVAMYDPDIAGNSMGALLSVSSADE